MNTSKQFSPSPNTLQDFLDSIYLLSKSQNSFNSYKIAVTHFLRFLDQKYHCSDVELTSKVKDGNLDIYKILNEFVVYLDKSGKKPSSIKGWISAVKSYLRYLGIKVYSEDCKNTVRLPKIRRQREEPLTKEILVRLLRVLPVKPQVAALCAIASGMRIGELVQLKISDIDFSIKPTTVRIRAETTKTKESRETYLTEEATKALKDYLTRFFGWKENETDEKVRNSIIFARTSGRSKEKEFYKKSKNSNPVFIAENVLSTSVKWHVRNIPEFNKLNENGRRVIHFHAFRKYFRTAVGNSSGRDFAEALIGHHFYLDTYYNLPVEKRRELYLKAEPYLTISDFVQIEKDLNKIQDTQKEIQDALARVGLKFSDVIEKKMSELA